MAKPRVLNLELLSDGRVAVSFPYNEHVVSRVRALRDRRWNPSLKRWEVGIGHLAALMEIFALTPVMVDKKLYRAYQMFRIRHGRVRISSRNVESMLSGADLCVDKIDKATSFFVPGYRYMPRYRKGQWDGRRHLFNEKLGTFPSGLVTRISRIVRDNGTEYDIVWHDDPGMLTESLDLPADRFGGMAEPEEKPSKSSRKKPFRPLGVELRDYQVQCAAAAVTHRRGVIEIATGGGKTLIAAEIIRRLNRPALFLVHTRDLLYQAIEVFQRALGIEIGQAGDGVIRIGQVTVATIQTCSRVFDIKIDVTPDDDEPLESDKTDVAASAEQLHDFIQSVPVVFFDECHHLPADTAFGLALEMTGAAWRYGLSATPYRADRQDLLIEAALGPRIYSARTSKLIEQNWLVPPRIEFLTAPKLAARTGSMDYQGIYSSCIVENKRRNKMVIETARMLEQRGLTTLILVAQVRHGHELQEIAPDIPLVQGDDPPAERKRIFDDLQERNLRIAIATTLADEGLNIPSLDAVILAGAGRSETRALQRVGRILRPSPGKECAYVFDFLDDAPYLKDHSRARLEIFQSEPAFNVCLPDSAPSDRSPVLAGKH